MWARFKYQCSTRNPRSDMQLCTMLLLLDSTVQWSTAVAVRVPLQIRSRYRSSPGVFCAQPQSSFLHFVPQANIVDHLLLFLPAVRGACRSHHTQQAQARITHHHCCRPRGNLNGKITPYKERHTGVIEHLRKWKPFDFARIKLIDDVNANTKHASKQTYV